MTYSPMLLVHIIGGMIAVAAGTIALVVRKGARYHRLTGNIFVVSMMIMGSSGAYVAFVKGQRFNVLAGTLAFYLVASAWLTVRRKANETGRVEVALTFIAIAAGIRSLMWGLETHAVGYYVFTTLAFLWAAFDVRMLIRGGVEGASRMVRHLGRMGFALFVAVGSFFLGTAGDPMMKKHGLRATLFTPEIRKTHLPEIPVLFVVLLTLFWLGRVLFTRTYKKAAITPSLRTPASSNL